MKTTLRRTLVSFARAGFALAAIACSSGGQPEPISSVKIVSGVPIEIQSAQAARTEIRPISVRGNEYSTAVSSLQVETISDSKRLVPTYAADIAAAALPEGPGAAHGSVSPQE